MICIQKRVKASGMAEFDLPCRRLCLCTGGLCAAIDQFTLVLSGSCVHTYLVYVRVSDAPSESLTNKVTTILYCAPFVP